jgi:hypothetical protein
MARRVAVECVLVVRRDDANFAKDAVDTRFRDNRVNIRTLLKLRGPLISSSPKESEPDGQAATIDSSRQAASIFLAQSLREVQSCKPQKRSNLLLSLLVPFLQGQRDAHY